MQWNSKGKRNELDCEKWGEEGRAQGETSEMSIKATKKIKYVLEEGMGGETRVDEEEQR